MSEKDISPSSEAVRKKQRLKTILTTIGDSLQPYFKTQIYEERGEKPSFISIENVISEEKGTSKSKVHFVTYNLNSDIGKHNVFLVVKFAADETRYEKEIKNYSILSEVPKNHPEIYMPEIIYKSPKNRCIIYEGIIGSSFRKSSLAMFACLSIDFNVPLANSAWSGTITTKTLSLTFFFSFT